MLKSSVGSAPSSWASASTRSPRWARCRVSPLAGPGCSWTCWTTGVLLRWATNIWAWQWRWMLPLSAVLELAGFVFFFITVRGHRSEGGRKGAQTQVWMRIVIAGTIGFLLSLLANLVTAFQAAMYAASPAIRARQPISASSCFSRGLSRCHDLGVQRSLATSVPRPARSTPSIAVVGARLSTLPRSQRLWRDRG